MCMVRKEELYHFATHTAVRGNSAPHAPPPYVSNQVQRVICKELCDIVGADLVERSADRKEGAAHLTWSSQSCMMRRLLSLVSLRKAFSAWSIDDSCVRITVTFAILHVAKLPANRCLPSQ